VPAGSDPSFGPDASIALVQGQSRLDPGLSLYLALAAGGRSRDGGTRQHQDPSVPGPVRCPAARLGAGDSGQQSRQRRRRSRGLGRWPCRRGEPAILSFIQAKTLDPGLSVTLCSLKLDRWHSRFSSRPAKGVKPSSRSFGGSRAQDTTMRLCRSCRTCCEVASTRQVSRAATACKVADSSGQTKSTVAARRAGIVSLLTSLPDLQPSQTLSPISARRQLPPTLRRAATPQRWARSAAHRSRRAQWTARRRGRTTPARGGCRRQSRFLAVTPAPRCRRVTRCRRKVRCTQQDIHRAAC